MDMLKQMRVRFSGIGEEEEEENKGGSSSTRERRIPPQKTPFKETKRAPSWLERQFIRTMSRDDDSSDSVDYPAAVAAAAFAVKSIQDKSNNDHRRINSEDKNYKDHKRTNSEDKSSKDHRRTSSGADDKPFARTKSKTADDIAMKHERFSDEASKPTPKAREKSVPIRAATIKPEPVNSAPSIKKTPTFGDTKPESEVSEKAKVAAAPSIKKKSTFTDQSIDITAPKTPVPEPAVSPTTMKPASGNSKADIWEKEEMEKIRERYKKLIKEIVEWETKKKKKAKRALERIEVESILNFNEAELDKRRAKAMRHFNNEVGRIESIAGGAKTQAEQNRVHEELKVKEKANKIRSTGKMPATCSCF